MNREPPTPAPAALRRHPTFPTSPRPLRSTRLASAANPPLPIDRQWGPSTADAVPAHDVDSVLARLNLVPNRPLPAPAPAAGPPPSVASALPVREPVARLNADLPEGGVPTEDTAFIAGRLESVGRRVVDCLMEIRDVDAGNPGEVAALAARMEAENLVGRIAELQQYPGLRSDVQANLTRMSAMLIKFSCPKASSNFRTSRSCRAGCTGCSSRGRDVCDGLGILISGLHVSALAAVAVLLCGAPAAPHVGVVGREDRRSGRAAAGHGGDEPAPRRPSPPLHRGGGQMLDSGSRAAPTWRPCGRSCAGRPGIDRGAGGVEGRVPAARAVLARLRLPPHRRPRRGAAGVRRNHPRLPGQPLGPPRANAARDDAAALRAGRVTG